MNECANHPYLSTNVTGAIKDFTSLQQVNDCDSGYDQGWNKYCQIGLAKHADSAAVCPGISGPKAEIKSTAQRSTAIRQDRCLLIQSRALFQRIKNDDIIPTLYYDHSARYYKNLSG